MEVFGRKTLEEFKKDHADSRTPLNNWVSIIEVQVWAKSTDVTATFNDATSTDSGWVFNIGGNNYRLLAGIAFTEGVVRVKKIGTHAEYDRWNL